MRESNRMSVRHRPNVGDSRATLAMKCDGLTDTQLRDQAVPPSSLSLLGLVRHMAEVERNWFGPLLAGKEMADLWATGPAAGSRAGIRRGGNR